MSSTLQASRWRRLLPHLLANLAFLGICLGTGAFALQLWQERTAQQSAEHYARLYRQNLLAPLMRELALAQRLAGANSTQRWLLREADPDRQGQFFREAEQFRPDFLEDNYHIVSALSGNVYRNPDGRWQSAVARYRRGMDDPLPVPITETTPPYRVQRAYDSKLGLDRIWIHALVHEGGRVLGVAGTSLAIAPLASGVFSEAPAGLSTLVFTPDGSLQLQAGTLLPADPHSPVLPSLPPALQQVLMPTLEQARLEAPLPLPLSLTYDGTPYQMALTYLPETNWYLLTARSPQSIVQGGWVVPLAGLLALLISGMLYGFRYWVERHERNDLQQLRRSAHAIVRGQLDTPLPTVAGNAAVDDLSRAFGAMADQVREHTRHLEDRVEARTAELHAANEAMRKVRDNIQASIEYASLIQRALLPRRGLQLALPDQHFVYWAPRDTVGGDLYLCHPTDTGYLLGVFDCAGHGVPGALMTMLVHTVLARAFDRAPTTDPVAVLDQAQRFTRILLDDAELPPGLATDTDIGLVHLDLQAGMLTYAGAKLALYVSYDGNTETYPGGRHALGSPRPNIRFPVHQIPLRPGATYYLLSDGFLDQAGGDQGYGFGTRRFLSAVQAIAHLSVAEQGQHLVDALSQYQGERPQRDDITLMVFRSPLTFPGSPP